MSTIAGQLVSGTLASAVIGTAIYQPSTNVIFNIFLYGTFSATVAVLRSPDQGVTWVPVALPTLSVAATFTTPINFECIEPDSNILWTVSTAVANGGAYTSGAVNYRIG